jgi:hypothetical protein
MFVESRVPEDLNTRLIYWSSLFTLWSADLLASQPYIGHDRLRELSQKIVENHNQEINYYINEVLEDFPFISNLPRIHRGGNKYDEFNLRDKDAAGNYLNSGRSIDLFNGIVKLLSKTYSSKT